MLCYVNHSGCFCLRATPAASMSITESSPYKLFWLKASRVIGPTVFRGGFFKANSVFQNGHFRFFSVFQKIPVFFTIFFRSGISDISIQFLIFAIQFLISVIHLVIYCNSLLISLIQFLISVNHLEISEIELEISEIELEISFNQNKC